jgi:hypothetical protein
MNEISLTHRHLTSRNPAAGKKIYGARKSEAVGPMHKAQEQARGFPVFLPDGHEL